MLLKLFNASLMPGTGTMPTPLMPYMLKGRPTIVRALTSLRRGKALADFNKSVLTAYPDLRFEIISSGDIGGGLVATQLMLRGTHTGPFMDGTPATGRTVAYPLASFAQIEGDKIRSQHIYLDRQTVAEQLGLTPKKT
jgi:predicted ester cyclase